MGELAESRRKIASLDAGGEKLKHATKRLGDLEDQCRSLIENTGDWVWETDSSFALTYNSPKMRDIMGYESNEVLGRTPFDFMPEDELVRVKEMAWPVISRREPIQRFENRLIRKDGSEAIIETSGMPLFDELGRYRGYRGVNRDVTAQRSAEDALRKNEGFLNNILDCIQDGISVLDKDLNVIRVNHIMEVWYPHAMPMRGKKCYAVYHGRSAPCEKCPSMRAIEHGTAQSEIVPYQGENGELKGWQEIFAYPLTDEHGAVIGVIEHVRDVTARKRAEDALQLMQYVIDQTQDEASLAGPDGRFVYVNDAKCRSLGYTREELLSMDIWDVDTEMTPDMWPAIWKDLKHKGFKKIEANHRSKDGRTFPTEIWTTYLDFHGNEYVCAFVRDVTERKRAEASLLKSEGKYRNLVENVDDWVWEIDDNCVYTYSSPKVRDILGYEPGEVIGKTPLDLMTPDEKARVAGIFDPIFERREPFALLENELVGKDGRRVTVETNGTPLFAEDGTFAGYMGVDRDISGRKQVEKSLKLTQFTMDRASDMVLWVAPDSRFIYVNEAACRTFGYTRDEMLAMTAFDTCPSWTGETWAEHWKGIKELGSFSIERPLMKKDGSFFPGEISVNYLVYDGNEYNCSFIRDITERKRAEEALRMASAYNRSLIEASLDPLMTIAPDGRITDVNMATEAVTGFPRTMLVGTDFSDYFTEPIKAKKGYMTAFKEGSVTDYPLEIRHRDGHATPVVYNASVYKDEAGKVTGVFAAARDVTERKRAEEALQESEKKFRFLAEATKAGILLYRDRKFVYVNPTLEKITGYDKNELMAKDFWEVVHPDDREMVRSRGFARQRGARVPATYEFQILAKDGSVKWVEISAAVIRYDGKKTVMATLFDITDRKRAEAELQEAKAEAELYLDLMGHDIKNLNQISAGFLELASELPGLDDDAKELITRPREAMAASTRLIENVRKLRKIKEGGLKFHEIDIGGLIAAIVPRYANVAGRNIKINLVPGCPCQVIANDLLEDVFSNIIGNAIKHSRGPLTVDVHINKVTVGDRKYCLVAIEDNGPGVPDVLKGELFTRFRGHKQRPNSRGLGLYIVGTLVEDFRGRVWVEDRVKGDYTQGARFTVLLPAVEPPS